MHQFNKSAMTSFHCGWGNLIVNHCKEVSLDVSCISIFALALIFAWGKVVNQLLLQELRRFVHLCHVVLWSVKSVCHESIDTDSTCVLIMCVCEGSLCYSVYMDVYLCINSIKTDACVFSYNISMYIFGTRRTC